MKKKWLLFFLVSCSLSLAAQQLDSLQKHRFVTSSLLFGVGLSNNYDTYISPLEYTGTEIRVMHERMRLTKWGYNRVSLQSLVQAHLSYCSNPADNNHLLGGLLNWNYGLHYHLPLTASFKLLVGAMADSNLGFSYNARNSNNPASLRAYLNLDLSTMAIYHFKLWNHPYVLRYELNVPIAGLLFSPEYQESYYELFQLDSKGNNLRFTSLHNQPSLRQLLSLDIPIGLSQLRVAYVCDIQQSKVNNLRTHAYSHAFMIGFVRSIYRIKQRKPLAMPAY